jgi:hypothetical protein
MKSGGKLRLFSKERIKSLANPALRFTLPLHRWFTIARFPQKLQLTTDVPNERP